MALIDYCDNNNAMVVIVYCDNKAPQQHLSF